MTGFIVKATLWFIACGFTLTVLLQAASGTNNIIFKLSAGIYFVFLAFFSFANEILAGVVVGVVVAWWLKRSISIRIDRHLEPIVLGFSVVALAHPILIFVGDPGFVTFRLESFITTLLAFLGIFVGIGLIGYLLLMKFRSPWVAVVSLLLFFAIFVNAIVVVPLSLVFFLGYLSEKQRTLDWLQKEHTKTPRASFLMASFVLILYYLFMDLFSLRGIYYSPWPRPDILITLSTPFFFGQGMLLHSVISNMLSQGNQGLLDKTS